MGKLLRRCGGGSLIPSNMQIPLFPSNISNFEFHASPHTQQLSKGEKSSIFIANLQFHFQPNITFEVKQQMKRGFQKFLLQNCFHNTKKMEKKRLDGVCIQHFFNLLFSKVKAFSKAIYDRDSREHQSFKRMFFPRFLTYNFSSSFLEIG